MGSNTIARAQATHRPTTMHGLHKIHIIISLGPQRSPISSIPSVIASKISPISMIFGFESRRDEIPIFQEVNVRRNVNLIFLYTGETSVTVYFVRKCGVKKGRKSFGRGNT
uniref:Uncharacterized protein n=1 Tax=Cacopsylla melanoneura TaxID=428564 RepID=A0A8D8LTA5_9HEMI